MVWISGSQSVKLSNKILVSSWMGDQMVYMGHGIIFFCFFFTQNLLLMFLKNIKFGNSSSMFLNYSRTVHSWTIQEQYILELFKNRKVRKVRSWTFQEQFLKTVVLKNLSIFTFLNVLELFLNSLREVHVQFMNHVLEYQRTFLNYSLNFRRGWVWSTVKALLTEPLRYAFCAS